MRISSKVTKRG